MGGNHVLLYGDSISLKTSLWKVATSSLKCDHFVVSNLALESPTSGLGDMKHIPLLEKKRNATGSVSTVCLHIYSRCPSPKHENGF